MRDAALDGGPGDGATAGAEAAAVGRVTVAGPLAGLVGAPDAGGDWAGPADPDAPGLTRKMPNPARARTITTKAAFRWPGVGSMLHCYFPRRIGRSQNGAGGAGLSPAWLPARGGAAPAAGRA